MVFPELKPPKSKDHYIPRVFGFKLHQTWHQRSLKAAKEAQLQYQQQQRVKKQQRAAMQAQEEAQRQKQQQQQQRNNDNNKQTKGN